MGGDEGEGDTYGFTNDRVSNGIFILAFIGNDRCVFCVMPRFCFEAEE